MFHAPEAAHSEYPEEAAFCGIGGQESHQETLCSDTAAAV